MANNEEERPRGELVPQQRTPATAEREAANPFALATVYDLWGKLSLTPKGEDPAYYPISVLNDFNYWIVNRDEIAKNPGGAPYAKFGEYAAPVKEMIRKVKTAYAILAYPHCQDWGCRFAIETELEQDRWSFERDQVELDEEELEALRKLAAARQIPVNPEKRVYRYREVLDAADSEKA